MIRGVLGGSFDPVHVGHLAMARYILDKNLAQILHIVPARISPHKIQNSADPQHRLAMVRLAFADQPKVIVDPREIDRPGPSFTVDTLEDLVREFPGDGFLLVIGADNLGGLSRWKDPGRIGAMADVAVLARGQVNAPPPPPGLPLRYYDDFDEPVSSTRIRAILGGTPRAPEDLNAFLPPAVAGYIARHHLYRD